MTVEWGSFCKTWAPYILRKKVMLNVIIIINIIINIIIIIKELGK